MAIEIKVLGLDDVRVVARVADDVFDDPIDPVATAEFLADPRHRLVVALDEGVVIAFASGVLYGHPDKSRPELWINEVGVAPSHRRRGVARRLIAAMLEEARRARCSEAWVLTDGSNVAACHLYEAAGGREAPGDHRLFTFALGERPPTEPV